MYTELNVNCKKVNKAIFKKCLKDLKNHFTREVTRLADKPIESCSTSLVTRKIQIKITIR